MNRFRQTPVHPQRKTAYLFYSDGHRRRMFVTFLQNPNLDGEMRISNIIFRFNKRSYNVMKNYINDSCDYIIELYITTVFQLRNFHRKKYLLLFNGRYLFCSFSMMCVICITHYCCCCRC